MTKAENSLRLLLNSLGYVIIPWSNKGICDPANVIYEQMIIHDPPNKGWIADFALPNAQIDIEVDGVYWHHPKNQKLWQIKNRLREERRTERLLALGWSIIRFSDRVIETNPEQVKTDIQTTIMLLFDV